MTDLIPNTSTPSGQQTLVSATGFGNRFTCAADTPIDTISWNRRTAGDGGPASLDIWRVSTAGSVAHVAVSGDTGATGWHNQTLSPAVTLLAGVDYIVGGNYAAGAVINYWATSPPAIGSGFTLVGARFGGGGAASPSMPDSVSSVELAAMSVSTAPPPPPPTGGSDGSTGVGDPTLTGDLEAWLSDDADLNKRHDDSAPYKTQALATGASGFAAIKGVADTIATNVGTLLTRWSAAMATTVQTTSDNVATLLTRWSAALATSLQAMSDDFATFFNTVGGTAGGPTGALSGRTEFPTELWTLVEETDFTFQISWDVPADLYTISLTGIPARINTVDVDGATWRPRVGWWALRNGDLLGDRRFLSWENEYVEDGGRRMPGIVIRTQPEIAGHVEAWRLT